MNINARLASRLPVILAREGFDVTIQQKSDAAGDFDADTPEWTALATVKGVWDNPRMGRKGLNDGAQSSMSLRYMSIAYRAGLKDTSVATRTRVVVDGVAHNIFSVSPIGEHVGMRLTLEAGTEPL